MFNIGRSLEHCYVISLQCIFVAFSTSGWKECHLISSERRARLMSQVPEHNMSQLLPNQEDTNANNGPKWWQFSKFSRLRRKFAFCSNCNFFSQMFNEGCIDSLVMGTLNPLCECLQNEFLIFASCSDGALTLKMSAAFQIFHCDWTSINSFDKTKFSCFTLFNTYTTPQFVK